MADDWRVELDVEDHNVLRRTLDRLRERASPGRRATASASESSSASTRIGSSSYA
jgi:hypothetical protein